MPWKVGGNFETALIMCEANWKECVVGIVNYLWCELVFDVVDYLTTEGIILWVLAITITLMILLRTKYHKNMRTKNIIISKHILNKVGYKIHDLELKVNVLTYKAQYGMWPLPHQIYSLNPKKSQKIKTTLSDPGNQKNWLKQLLPSPTESIVRTTYSSVSNSSVTEPTNFFDIKQKNNLHAQDGKSSMDCSSIGISESTSDRFIKCIDLATDFNSTCSQQSEMYMQNVNARKSDQSNSENFTLQRRNVQLLSSDMDKDNHRSWKPFSIQDYKRVASTTNIEYNPSQRFPDTIHECKSFLKGLGSNNKYLHLSSHSLKKSEVSSSNDVHVTRQPTLLMTEKSNACCSIRKPTKKNSASETKYMNAAKEHGAVENIYEVYRRSNVDITSTDAIAVTSNDDGFSKQLAPILPTAQSTHNLRSSQEILYEVRKRLQSLHNVLRMYENTSRSSEVQKSLDPVGEIVEAFVSAGSRIEETDEKKTDANRDAVSKKSLQQIRYSIMDNYECFELDHSEQSSPSLIECSSNGSNKTYRFSTNVASQGTHSTKYNQHNITKKIAQTGNHPAFKTIQSKDSSPFYNAMLYAPVCYENRCERNACEYNISDRSRSYELGSDIEINGNVTETNVSCSLAERKSEVCTNYILSPGSTEDDQSKNQTFSITKEISIEKFNDTSDEERYRENVIISRNSSRSKILKSSDRKEKSTAMLLREALHFKKALLTRVMSEKGNLLHITKDNSNPDESASEHEMQNKSNNNLSSMMLTEKSDTNVSRGKINQRYVYLEMKQRRDVFPQSLQNVNAFMHCESERNMENKSLVPETPSEYFSISDLAIRDDDEIESNVPSSLEPIYEKIISITIPINIENEDIIKTNEKSIQTKTVLENICADSRQNLSRYSSTDDIGSDEANLPTTLKLEDLILERVKNIRDYMDIFLRNQNRAIFKARKALRNDIFQCSNEAGHVITNNRLTAPSFCDNKNFVAKSWENSQRPDLLINTLLPNYKHEIFIDNDILRCCSDLHLKRNPGMFTFIAPIKNTFSNENDTRLSKVATELKRKKTDISPSVTFKYSCENDPHVTKLNATSLDKSSCKKHMTLNIKDGKIDEQTITDINTDFQELGKQTQTHTENKFSEIYFELDNPRDDTNIVTRMTGNGHEESHYNLISKSSSYFTDEAANDVKIDKVSSESISNVMHLHAKSHEREKIEADIVEVQMLVNKCPNANVVRSSKLPLNTSYCKLNAFTDSDLIPNKSRSGIYDTDAPSLPFLSDINRKILNTNDSPVNNIEQNKSDETLANVARFSSRIEDHPIKQLCHTYSRIKAKSDISLTSNALKNLKIDCPKRSHFFILRDPSKDACKMLRQSNINDNKNKYVQSENKSRSTTQSRSVASTQRMSKFYIPILKDRLEVARRMKRQTHTKSPTRSPLTMLRREKICTKSRTTNEEVTRGNNIPINQLNLSVEETKSNLTKLNIEEKILAKEQAKTCKSNITVKDNSLCSEQSIESLEINKEYSDKKLLCGSREDTRVVESTKNTAPKTVAIISIATNDNLRRNHLTDPFILKTENACSATDSLRCKKGSRATIIEKTEKEVTAKPSITDTCTSMSDLH